MAKEKTVYVVNGMKCNGCVAAVKDALTRLPSVVETQIDLGTGTATVVGDVDPESVIRTLADIGYPATVQDG